MGKKSRETEVWIHNNFLRTIIQIKAGNFCTIYLANPIICSFFESATTIHYLTSICCLLSNVVRHSFPALRSETMERTKTIITKQIFFVCDCILEPNIMVPIKAKTRWSNVNFYSRLEQNSRCMLKVDNSEQCRHHLQVIYASRQLHLPLLIALYILSQLDFRFLQHMYEIRSLRTAR